MLKYNKDELSLVQLGSHFRIKETLKMEENGNVNGKEIAGSSFVNMVEDDKNKKNNKNSKRNKRKFHDKKNDSNKKSKMALRDTIFDENRFFSIPRPKDIISSSNGTQGGDLPGETSIDIPEPRRSNRARVAKSSCSWEEVLAKIFSRLSKWKLKTLFICGRLTLIKSVLKLPLYQMSIYKVPMGVLNRMESIRRNFFNDVDNKERKISMIGWKKILASKKNEGPGVSSFFALNRAFLFKWIWRHSPWIVIIQEFESLSFKVINLHSFVKKKVGNGEHTLFWEDTWLTNSLLKIIFARLYALECEKLATVAAKFKDSSMFASFRRAPCGGSEEEQLHLLVDKVTPIIMSSLNDRKVWSLDSLGDFSVRSARSYIDDSLLPTVAYEVKFVSSRDRYSVYSLSHLQFCWKVFFSLLFSCNVACHLLLKVARWWELEIQDFHYYVHWLSWFNTLRLYKELKYVLEGFRFGKVNLDPDEEDRSEFHMRVFLKIENLKGEYLLELVNKDIKLAELDDEDVVRVCLLLALYFVFMGHELRHVVSKPIVKLVDDFYKWEALPWGEYMWSFFYKRDYNIVVTRRKFHLEKLARNPKYEANYVLYGFVFPLKRFFMRYMFVMRCLGYIPKKRYMFQLLRKDIQERDELLKTVNEQKQMIIDMQTGNLSKNAPDCGIDQQSMCGVRGQPGLNEEYESVVVDGLISLQSQDVGHLSKVQDACVFELLDVVKDDVNVNSVVKEEILKDDVNVNSLVKEDTEKDDVHVDSFMKEDIKKDDVQFISVMKDAEKIENETIPHKKFPGKAYLSLYIQPPSSEVKYRKRRREIKLEKDVTLSPTAQKRIVTVPEEVNALFCDKNKMEMKWTFPWLSHNIPLEVDDLISFALEYHERLIEFF
uniref:Phospholipase-like protein n=1 Tax=Tanacetum cinerariifolium TaxID=118510 RepID=A0A699H2Q1_TANCI|nr:hypothetical protein [Tanacetum cinerariifolium]